MNEVLHFEKGSSGYSAPGPLGLSGDGGINSHFSAYDLTNPTDIGTIITRINDSSCLTNNNTLITYEKYKTGDIIIDRYGNVGVLNLNSANNTVDNIVNMGNMIFYDTPNNTDDPQSATDPLQLVFDCSTNLVDIDSNEQVKNYLSHTQNDSIIDGSRSPLWHHRWNMKQTAKSCELKPSTNDSSIDFDNITSYTSCAFMKKILSLSDVSKICCVFTNGLVYEKIFKKGDYEDNDIYIKIPINYLDTTYDTHNYPKYDNMGQEETGYINVSGLTSYIDLIKNQTACKLYFEYTYKNKKYRLNIKCQ